MVLEAHIQSDPTKRYTSLEYLSLLGKAAGFTARCDLILSIEQNTNHIGKNKRPL